MSFGIARKGDRTSSHSDFSEQYIIEGSENVFINNKECARVSDKASIHCNQDECHDGEVVTGSKSVFVNNKPVASTGDLISCGSIVLEVSENVFIGE